MTYTFNKKYIWLLSVICTALFVGVLIMSTPFVFAQEKQVEYTLLEPLPCIESAAVQNERGEVVTPAITCGGNTQMTSINFENYVQYAFNLVIALAAVLAVFMIVWGGFEYMSSDSYNQKSAGLEKLKNAVYGLVLILCSYLILRTIDPRLVQIPTTLVTPIDIRCASNNSISVFDSNCSSGTSTFFDQILREAAEKDLAFNKEIMRQRDEAKRAEEAINTRLASIETQLKDARQKNDTALVNGLEKDKAALEIQKIDAHTTAVVKAAESGIVYSTAANSQKTENDVGPGDNTLETIREQNNTATKYYDQGMAELRKMGSPADKIAELDNQYWPRHGTFLLQIYAKPESGTLEYRINSINRMLDITIPKITDQAKKTELQTSANSILSELNRLKNAAPNYYVPLTS